MADESGAGQPVCLPYMGSGRAREAVTLAASAAGEG